MRINLSPVVPVPRSETSATPKGTAMPGLLDTLVSQLESRGAVDQIAAKLGIPPGQANSAIGAALPAILAGLANNAKQPDGAAALAGALDRDHDGSVLDDDDYFNHYEEKKGANILGHVFGAKTPAVESQVSALSGLNGVQGAELMKMLAPLIMGYLGKQKSGGGLDIGSLSQILLGGAGGSGGGLKLPGGLGEILGGMQGSTPTRTGSSASKPAPASGGFGGILTKIFGKKK